MRELVERLESEDFIRPATIGGGDWSAKDLLGHLTSWEEHALGALAAWRQGEPAPIQRALRVHGLNAVNAEAVADIGSIPEATWDAPPTTRSRRSLGHVVGGIVGGPDGPFSHASAHLPHLQAYVESVRDPGPPAPGAPGTPGPGG